MADAAALDAHQHFAAARLRTIDDRSRKAAARKRRAIGGASWSCRPLLHGVRHRRHHARDRAARREPAPAPQSLRPGCPRRAPSGSSPRRQRSAGTSTPSERRLWRSILRRCPKAACVTPSRSWRSQGSGAARGSEAHHRRGDFRRRHEGGRIYVEQNAGFAAPLRQHRKPPVAFRAGRGDDAFGDFALEHQDRGVVPGRPRLGADQQTSSAVAML